MAQFLIGMSFGIGIAYLAYRAGSLNRQGGIAAGVLGTVVFGLGGVSWAAVLLTFFISSSVLSRVVSAEKNQTNQDFAKGSRRDAWQVAANGGFAGLLALLYFLIQRLGGSHTVLPLFWIGFAASLAGANADTWATELGVYNPRLPILLTKFIRVPRGTSGAVSLVGTLVAVAGAALVASVAVLFSQAGLAPALSIQPAHQLLIITAAGWFGSLVDSFFGATIQVIYFCPVCEKGTERHPVHGCGTQTIRFRGLVWLNNDWVNAACTVSAGILGLILTLFK